MAYKIYAAFDFNALCKEQKIGSIITVLWRPLLVARMRAAYTQFTAVNFYMEIDEIQ